MTTGVVEALVRQNERVAHEQARLLALVHQVVNAAPDPRFGVDEVAFALTWTHQAAASQEQLAHQLIVDLPEVFTALSDGHIDLPKARVFADVLGVLDGEIARRVAAEVLSVASEKTTGQLRDRLQRRAPAADPQHARKRRERGQAERRVILEVADDGTASLSAFGLAPSREAAAYERVTAIAKAKKLAGATQTMDQLRADALLDLLEGVDIGASPTARCRRVDRGPGNVGRAQQRSGDAGRLWAGRGRRRRSMCNGWVGVPVALLGAGRPDRRAAIPRPHSRSAPGSSRTITAAATGRRATPANPAAARSAAAAKASPCRAAPTGRADTAWSGGGGVGWGRARTSADAGSAGAVPQCGHGAMDHEP